MKISMVFVQGVVQAPLYFEVIEDVRSNIDQGQITILVLLDFSKAFDSVDHNILLAKLKNIGLAEHTLKWFQEYLSNRKQVVVTRNCRSNILNTHKGVAQGSVLGPLAFLIYVNDVGNSLKYCNHQMYADDLQLYISGHQTEVVSMIEKLNNDLASLFEWATSLGLLLNLNKSQCLAIGTKYMYKKLIKCSLPDVCIDGTPLPWINTARNLGIHIENSLNWETQTNKICQKVYHSLHTLRCLKDFLPPLTKIYLVKSLIMPHFDYCDFLLTDINSKQKRKLQIAQNACIRYAFNFSKNRKRIRFLF